MSSFDAVILAAGRGSRMEELTRLKPKCLLELAGKPLLEWQLAALRAAGASGVTVVTGYRGEMIAGYGMNTVENPRWSETNMVSSLLCAAPLLESRECVVTYSDIVYGPSAVRALLGCGADKETSTSRGSPRQKHPFSPSVRESGFLQAVVPLVHGSRAGHAEHGPDSNAADGICIGSSPDETVGREASDSEAPRRPKAWTPS
ncbi:MAG: NTP transferase domain-containing protein [Thermodesulfobacteriota bacterium]|jgi:molybdopterin-guanine dinucleotide biosynthesis protein A